MTDLREIINIPANTWIKVVDGKQRAKIKRKDSSADYFSLIYDDILDIPTNGVFPTTSERIFIEDDAEFLNSSVDAYVWIACKDGKTGQVQITRVP